MSRKQGLGWRKMLWDGWLAMRDQRSAISAQPSA
jgi:hypothetical protein